MTTPAPKKALVINLKYPIPKLVRRPLAKEVTLALAVLTGKTRLPWLPGDIRRKIFALAFYCTHLCGEGRKKCCWCGDKRTYQPAYPMYLDGKGYRSIAKRHEYYCPTCKNAASVKR